MTTAESTEPVLPEGTVFCNDICYSDMSEDRKKEFQMATGQKVEFGRIKELRKDAKEVVAQAELARKNRKFEEAVRLFNLAIESDNAADELNEPLKQLHKDSGCSMAQFSHGRENPPTSVECSQRLGKSTDEHAQMLQEIGNIYLCPGGCFSNIAQAMSMDDTAQLYITDMEETQKWARLNRVEAKAHEAKKNFETAACWHNFAVLNEASAFRYAQYLEDLHTRSRCLFAQV